MPESHSLRQRKQAGRDLELFSLQANCHIAGRMSAGCRGRKVMDGEAIGPGGGGCATVALLNAKLPFKYHVYTHRLVMLSTLVRCAYFYRGWQSMERFITD